MANRKYTKSEKETFDGLVKGASKIDGGIDISHKLTYLGLAIKELKSLTNDKPSKSGADYSQASVLYYVDSYEKNFWNPWVKACEGIDDVDKSPEEAKHAINAQMKDLFNHVVYSVEPEDNVAKISLPDFEADKEMIAEVRTGLKKLGSYLRKAEKAPDNVFEEDLDDVLKDALAKVAELRKLKTAWKDIRQKIVEDATDVRVKADKILDESEVITTETGVPPISDAKKEALSRLANGLNLVAIKKHDGFVTGVGELVDPLNDGRIVDVGNLLPRPGEVEPIEEPIEEPVVEPIEEPIEEPVVEPVEEPIPDATEPLIPTSSDDELIETQEPVEEPVEVPIEEPVEEPVEIPVSGAPVTLGDYMDGSEHIIDGDHLNPIEDALEEEAEDIIRNLPAVIPAKPPAKEYHNLEYQGKKYDGFWKRQLKWLGRRPVLAAVAGAVVGAVVAAVAAPAAMFGAAVMVVAGGGAVALAAEGVEQVAKRAIPKYGDFIARSKFEDERRKADKNARKQQKTLKEIEKVFAARGLSMDDYLELSSPTRLKQLEDEKIATIDADIATKKQIMEEDKARVKVAVTSEKIEITPDTPLVEIPYIEEFNRYIDDVKVLKAKAEESENEYEDAVIQRSNNVSKAKADAKKEQADEVADIVGDLTLKQYTQLKKQQKTLRSAVISENAHLNKAKKVAERQESKNEIKNPELSDAYKKQLEQIRARKLALERAKTEDKRVVATGKVAELPNGAMKRVDARRKSAKTFDDADMDSWK